MKNSIVILMLLILIVFMFNGCGPDKKEIAVLIYDMEDPYIKGVSDYIQDYDTKVYDIVYYDSQKSQIVQNKIAEELYEKGVDLLVINPVERLSSYVFVRKSLQEEIPIIFFNREPLKEDLEYFDDVYYVGTDARESGLMQAKLISEGLNNDTKNLGGFDKNGDQIIQCVILKGEQGHQDAEERTKSVIEGLEREGFKVEVLHTTVANWNETRAYRAMHEIMSEFGDDIELLISNNDAMAIGASKYLMDNGYFGVEVDGVVTDVPFRIVGIDGLEEAKLLTKKGYMYGTIINDGKSMAEAIMQLAEYVLENDDEKLQYELVDNKYILISYKYHSNE
jgi:methyl-galactoside transport system substrate-binding protein